MAKSKATKRAPRKAARSSAKSTNGVTAKSKIIKRNGKKYRQIIDTARAPFWTPQDKEKKHPKEVEGTVIGFRTMPAKGKFGEQKLMIVDDPKEGIYSVKLNASLEPQVEAAGVGDGQGVYITYDGQVKLSGRRQPMNKFSLYVEE